MNLFFNVWERTAAVKKVAEDFKRGCLTDWENDSEAYKFYAPAMASIAGDAKIVFKGKEYDDVRSGERFHNNGNIITRQVYNCVKSDEC